MADSCELQPTNDRILLSDEEITAVLQAPDVTPEARDDLRTHQPDDFYRVVYELERPAAALQVARALQRMRDQI